MTKDQITAILAQLADHENRLKRLEGGVQSFLVSSVSAGGKQKTLREVVKGKKLKNGPEKVAVIVGYYEKLLGKLINKKDIGKAWIEAKLDGTYKTNLLDDAVGAYVRVQSDENCDLTQTGEEFFEKFLKNESTDSTSK